MKKNSIKEKIIRVKKNPWAIFLLFLNRSMSNWVNDSTYLKLNFRASQGRKLNLKNPKSFNEKLQWLKLYDRNPLYTTLVDKYAVKEYIAQTIGNEYVIPTIGVWDSFDDIPFDELPNRFVLKCTHDSGGNIIVRDKSQLDLIEAKEKINSCLKNNYYYSGREWPYKDVSHKIIAEKYMEDAVVKKIVDYKFYCFNGEPKFLYVSQGQGYEDKFISFVTLEWTQSEYQRSDYPPFKVLPAKPSQFDHMLSIAKQLSIDIPFVRVDLYEINGQVYFSEMTFFPSSGLVPFKDPAHDFEIGEFIHLPEVDV